MRLRFPIILLLGSSILAAQEELAPFPVLGEVSKKKLAAVSLLPSGSRLQRVMLPRYDQERRISGVLTADTMTLQDEETILGEHVTIGFYNPDQTPRGECRLVHAIFHQSRGTLSATEEVHLQTDRIRALGHGLTYSIEHGEGLLHGPVTTWIQASSPTTMNPKQSVIGAAAALSLVSAAPTAQPPAPTAAEKQAIMADAAPSTATHAAAANTSRSNLRADLAASSTANAAAQKFLEDHQDPTAADTPSPPKDPAKPLDLPASPLDTLVTSDRGMYFDSDNGLFVYLGNVNVKDPRFELTGADELKIFLEKKQPTPTQAIPSTTAASPTPVPKGQRFGDVERIVATGAVRILQKQPQPGKEPVEASGGIFTYQPKTGQIILTGRYPWVKQGSTYMRAKEPDLILRIQKSGSFVTEGKWDMGGKMNQKTP